MILPDVNVLIYSFRRDLSQHAGCRAWLAGVVMSDARFGLSPLVWGAVVRVTTNPRVYRTPSTIEEAFGFCENLLGQPHCQIVEPGERHWDIFKRLCIETETRGSRVTDAWFAALAIEWGCGRCRRHPTISYIGTVTGCSAAVERETSTVIWVLIARWLCRAGIPAGGRPCSRVNLRVFTRPVWRQRRGFLA